MTGLRWVAEQVGVHLRPPGTVDPAGSAGSVGPVGSVDPSGPDGPVGPLDPRLGDLPVGMALRTAPGRVHLLVSTVLGKHVPVPPRVVLRWGAELGARTGAAVDAEPVGLVVGFAETATGLGHEVAAALGADYLHTTRHPGAAAAALIEITEAHSHAPHHLLAPDDVALLSRDGVTVLVDDELSTGRTAVGLVRMLQRRHPRRQTVDRSGPVPRYVIATLLDTRGPQDRAWMAHEAAELGVRIEVVALREAVVGLEPTAGSRAAAHVRPPVAAAAARAEPSQTTGREPVVVDAGWPQDLPTGGRGGWYAADADRLRAAVRAAAARVVAALPPADEHAPGGARRLHVLGHEELMFVPTLIAAELERGARPGDVVTVSATTRSPAVVVDEPGYPLRSAVVFPAAGLGADGTRYAYNLPPCDVLVVVVDETVDPAALLARGGQVSAVQAVCDAVVVLRVSGGGGRRGPRPLYAPRFSTVHRRDVEWLVRDLSEFDLERSVADRELSIQSGLEHYAESLPIEYVPTPEYLELFDSAVRDGSRRVAAAVGTVAERAVVACGPGVVLISLARAGVPAGVLMRRWLAHRHGWDVPHHAVSIVRGRGIDQVALAYLLARYAPKRLLFVDAWTGKGAIATELRAAVGASPWAARGLSARLAVLTDPGRCADLSGSREDFLIASACLNATGSGLVSRTVLHPRLTGPDGFHGAKFYPDLAPGDRTHVFLDAVTAQFDVVQDQVADAVREAQPVPEPGWATGHVAAIGCEYGVTDVHRIKPGVGETTRVLLRRVPDMVLVRARTPEVAPVLRLAGERGVPVRVLPELPFACVGLIRATQRPDV